ncbi:hypothetical protein GCWU000341_00374 [Oribacterium sp. oral taxon 078 str. F0262]|nr:hypothetical protein GCWU000341_00374 [Oribacterium sp. oral taxon 078 str. F0262]
MREALSRAAESCSGLIKTAGKRGGDSDIMLDSRAGCDMICFEKFI